MIKGLAVRNARGETYDFPLEGVSANGIIVTEIDGIGPVKAEVSMEGVYNVDGGLFTGVKTGARNIVASFALPESNPQDRRRVLYRAFPVKEKVLVNVLTVARTYTIDAYVESVAPSIFTPIQTVQVSLICPFPYFRQVEAYSSGGTDFTAVTSKFTFPISTPPDKIFGDTTRSSIMTVDYLGDAPVGALFRFALKDNPGTVSIINHKVGGEWKMDFNIYKRIMNYTPGVGDTLEVDARDENLYAVVWRNNGQRVLVTGMVEFGSVWPKLYPGENRLEVRTTYNTPLLSFSAMDMMYSPLFLGV